MRSYRAGLRHSGAHDAGLLLDSQEPGQPSPPYALPLLPLDVYTSFFQSPHPAFALCLALGRT